MAPQSRALPNEPAVVRAISGLIPTGERGGGIRREGILLPDEKRRRSISFR